jgi:hypothetical protein
MKLRPPWQWDAVAAASGCGALNNSDSGKTIVSLFIAGYVGLTMIKRSAAPKDRTFATALAHLRLDSCVRWACDLLSSHKNEQTDGVDKVCGCGRSRLPLVLTEVFISMDLPL